LLYSQQSAEDADASRPDKQTDHNQDDAVEDAASNESDDASNHKNRGDDPEVRPKYLARLRKASD